MRSNSSQEITPSTTKVESREELDKLLLQVESRVPHLLRKDGRLTPTLFTLSDAGLSIYSPGSLNNMVEGNNSAAIARLICAAQGAIVAVMATEGFIFEAKHRSQPSRPQVYICLIGEALGGSYRQRLLPILFDRRGRFSCLGKPKVLPSDPPEGPLTNLLPSTPLTDDVRAFAALMLSSRGLVMLESRDKNRSSGSEASR